MRLVLLCFIFLVQDLTAQEWLWAKRNSGDLSVDSAKNVLVTAYYHRNGVLCSTIDRFSKSGYHYWHHDLSFLADVSCVDRSGNIFLAGRLTGTVQTQKSVLYSTGAWDFFVVKLDQSGNEEWAKAFGGGSSEVVRALACDEAGNIYITGAFVRIDTFDTFSAGNSSLRCSWDHAMMFLLKVDGSGLPQWIANSKADFKKQQVDMYGMALKADKHGHIIVLGDGSEGVFSAVFDTTGKVLSRAISTGGSAWYNPRYYIGDVNSFYIYYEDDDHRHADKGYICRLDSAMNQVWLREIASPIRYVFQMDKFHFLSSVSPGDNGELYLAGGFGTVGTDIDTVKVLDQKLVSRGGGDLVVARIQPDGSVDWIKTLASKNTEFAYPICASGEDELYISYQALDSLENFVVGQDTVRYGAGYLLRLVGGKYTAVNDESISGLLIYPIPAQKELHVEGLGRDAKLDVVDTDGNNRISLRCESENCAIDVSGLVPGLYFLRVIQAESVIVRKLIITE